MQRGLNNYVVKYNNIQLYKIQYNYKSNINVDVCLKNIQIIKSENIKSIEIQRKILYTYKKYKSNCRPIFKFKNKLEFKYSKLKIGGIKMKDNFIVYFDEDGVLNLFEKDK